MKRRLFNLAALLSLLLCLACLAMWVRSGYVADHLRRNYGNGRQVAFRSAVGSFSFQVGAPPLPAGLPGRWQWWSVSRRAANAGPAWDWRWPWHYSGPLLFGGGSGSPGSFATMSAKPMHTQVLVLPYWLLFLGTALLPGLWCWKRRQEQRRARRGFPVEARA